MNIQTDISWIQSELTKVKDPELILVFKNLLKYSAKHVKTDWWDEISNEEKAEIQEGVKEIEEGNFIAHEEVMVNPRKWN